MVTRWHRHEPAKQVARSQVFLPRAPYGMWGLNHSFQARLTEFWFLSRLAFASFYHLLKSFSFSFQLFQFGLHWASSREKGDWVPRLGQRDYGTRAPPCGWVTGEQETLAFGSPIWKGEMQGNNLWEVLAFLKLGGPFLRPPFLWHRVTDHEV